MNTVIKIENIYKEYKLGVIGHGTLYRDLQSFYAKIKGKEDPNSKLFNKQFNESILALEDINLDIKDGDVLGIIGQNGAGKSTLLKIISKITKPSKGSIKIKGKVSSLLEVGTGFHAELTGKENIYLNGSINGMKKIEIDKKIDEIIDFAGVEKFIDTPIKRYSTGMTVRLGFAVAAFLEPDILIVDEVLAVGDANFRNKAMKKMEEISTHNGRTILFVSHNLNSIKDICKSGIVLDKGKIQFQGNSLEAVDYYVKGVKNIDYKQYLNNNLYKRSWGDKRVIFKDFYICDHEKNNKNIFNNNEFIYFNFEFLCNENVDNLTIEGSFLSDYSIKSPILHFKELISNNVLSKGTSGKIKIKLNPKNITYGEFSLRFILKGKEMYQDYDILTHEILPKLQILKNEKDEYMKTTAQLFNCESEINVKI